MKKIISVFLSFAMLSATVVSAAYNSKDDILNDGNISGLGITTYENVVNQTVDADILVRASGASTYADGPINVEKTASEQFPKFDFKAEFEMSDVWGLMEWYIRKGSLLSAPTDLNAVPVRGQFDVKVIYPKNLNIPATFTEAGNLYGFNEEVKRSGIFTELAASRNVSHYDSLNNVLTITVVASSTCGELKEAYNSGSPKFELECLGVQPTAYGTYTVKGEVDGKIKIGDPTIVDEEDYIGVVKYNAVQKGTASNDTLNASVSVTQKSSTPGGTVPGGGVSGGIYIPPTINDGIKIEFDINGNRDIIKPITGATSVVVNYDQIKPAAIEGMTFDGWYLDPAFTAKFTVEGTVMTNLVLYGRYVITDAPEVFDDAHKAYIKGYPDGTVQPMGLITREEITTALYRLLKDSVVEKITTTENNYSDVEADRWSVTSISSMTKGGYIKGYEDGTFRPANDITRAEFATLVLRFFADTKAITGGDKFIDIDSHWAEENIIKAEAMGLFNGYEDGTFRPDAYITRAEAMAVINRITVRRANNNSFVGNFINWPDISTSNWYYADVIEATNTHNFTRIDELMNEQWTDVSYTDLIVG